MLLIIRTMHIILDYPDPIKSIDRLDGWKKEEMEVENDLSNRGNVETWKVVKPWKRRKAMT